MSSEVTRRGFLGTAGTMVAAGATVIDTAGERPLHAGQLTVGGEQIVTDNALVAEGILRDIGPADYQRHSDAALPDRSLSAAERSSPTSAAPIIGHVDHVGVAFYSKPPDAVYDHTNPRIEVFG